MSDSMKEWMDRGLGDKPLGEMTQEEAFLALWSTIRHIFDVDLDPKSEAAWQIARIGKQAMDGPVAEMEPAKAITLEWPEDNQYPVEIAVEENTGNVRIVGLKGKPIRMTFRGSDGASPTVTVHD